MLYVNNLSWKTTDEEFFEHFCTAAPPPNSAEVQRERGGRSKGWGLVVYSSVENAELARLQLNKTILGEREIFVRYDEKKPR